MSDSTKVRQEQPTVHSPSSEEGDGRLEEVQTEKLRQSRRKGRVNLFERWPWLERVVKNRAFQFAVILPNFLLFLLFILAGVLGTPVGSHNIIIVFVWILWWALLIAVLIPFGGRIWCTACPIPAMGDWVQRRRLIDVVPGKSAATRNRLFGRQKRWPNPLQNIWLQNIGFLLLATFSAFLVTRPIVSALVLGGLMLLALIIALFYRGRTFCQYLCPVGGFLNLYSMTAVTELRAEDRERCRTCREKSCIRGSDEGWACPWGLYIGNMERNNSCGLCFECVKSCPYDNVKLYARPFGSDTSLTGYDEAWKAFIMLALAAVYTVTFLGPWPMVKAWANVTQSGNWTGFGLFAGTVWTLALGVTPGLHALTTLGSRALAGTKEIPFKHIFLVYAYPLVPLGLLAWIAFSVPLILVNGSYILSVVSDPFGWGWDLFGTANVSWQPFLPEWIPVLQTGLLLIGLGYALKRGYQVSGKVFESRKPRLRSLIPLYAWLGIITVFFLRIFAG